MSMALSAQNQWTYLRTLSYNIPEGPPPMHITGYDCNFDGVGYASMDFGLYGTTIYTIYGNSGGPINYNSKATVYEINESTGGMLVVYSDYGFGAVGKAMVTEKKLGKVYRFGTYQGIPAFRVLDNTGNVTSLVVHPWGWTHCFSALDENHLYSIYEVGYAGGIHLILYSQINGVGTAIDTLPNFYTPKKIDFPATDRGYMSVVDEENDITVWKLLRCSSDLRSWDAIYQTSDPIADFVFDEVNTGYAVVRPGIIIKTTDGGETWDTIYNNPNQTLNRVDVVDENIVFACGNNGLILRTVDGGAQWTQDPFTSTDNLDQIIMFDKNNGYAMSGRNCYRLTSIAPDKDPQFDIAPNPSVGATKITSRDMMKTLEVIDNTGKVLLVQEVESKEYILNYFPHSTGIYFIRVTFANGKQNSEKILFAH